MVYIMLFGLNVFTALLGIKALSSFLTIKNTLWKKALLLAGFWLLISMIIHVGDFDNLPPTFLFFMLSLFIACEGPCLKIVAVGIIFSCTALSFSGLADNFILPLLPIFNIQARCLLTFIFWGAAYFIIRKKSPDKDYELPQALWRLIFLLALTPFSIVVAIVLFSASSFYLQSSVDRVVYLFLLVISLFAFTGLLWTITVLSSQQKLVRHNALLHANESYYEAIREQQFEVRRLKHDLSNHLQVLYSLPAADKDNYIQSLLNTPVYSQTLHYSNDDTVNAVLTAKKTKIDKANIKFYAKIDIPRELPFAKTDTCAVLANALDNAIESCNSLPADNRMIKLEAGWRKSLFVLRISNSAKGTPIRNNRLPATTKANKLHHGYGLRSIREITERYGGSMEINTDHEEFCLLLYLPAIESHVP